MMLHKTKVSDVLPRTSDSTSPQQLLVDRYRCPKDVADFQFARDLSSNSGYFRLGPDAICYGQCSSGAPAMCVTDALHDARPHVVIDGSSVYLPFDPLQVVDNLRCERYHPTWKGIKTLPSLGALRRLYKFARPALGTSAREQLQRLYFRRWDKIPFPRWPVESTIEDVFEQLLVFSMASRRVDRIPFIWFWPEGADSCTIITHDVETAAGRDYCPQLMDINESFGIKASFQIVPEGRYTVRPSALKNMRERGFEVNIHDLNHDGCLTCNREEFLRRARRINHYGRQFGARGFRSAVMYRNTDWYDALDFSYDMSIPSLGHLEAQQGGCCTVLPFFIGKILELPLTTIQDYSLFRILRDHSTRVWKEQIDLIRSKYGLISFLIHPDYATSQGARRVYSELLQHLSDLRSQKKTWIAAPGEVATWWRQRSELTLANIDGTWRIEGHGKEKARVAWATLTNGGLTYTLGNSEVLPELIQNPKTMSEG
jgi:hypothetical protein